MKTHLLFILLLCSAIGQSGFSQSNSAPLFTYRGFSIDTSFFKAESPEKDYLLTFFKTQVDIVCKVPLKDSVYRFMTTVPVTIGDSVQYNPAACSNRDGIVRFYYKPSPNFINNPVFLHELLHAYHRTQPKGVANPEILGFYQHARENKLYPDGSYVLRDPYEFFAVTGSIILFGNIPRPPFSEENITKVQPELTAFLKKLLQKPL